MGPFILLLSLFLLAGAGLYLIIRRKDFRPNLEDIVQALTDLIFPGRDKQIEDGAHEIMKLLRGKVNFSEAKEIYIQKTRSFFFERFDPANDEMRVFLKDKDHTKLNYFDKIELYDFFVEENERLKKEFWIHGFCMGHISEKKKSRSMEKVKVVDANDSFFELFNLQSGKVNSSVLQISNGIPDPILDDLIRVSQKGNILTREFPPVSSGYLPLQMTAYSSRPGRFVAFFSGGKPSRLVERKTA